MAFLHGANYQAGQAIHLRAGYRQNSPRRKARAAGFIAGQAGEIGIRRWRMSASMPV
jgi:hypothetical protein